MILSRLRPQCRLSSPMPFAGCVRVADPLSCTGANADAMPIYRRSSFCRRGGRSCAHCARLKTPRRTSKAFILMSDYPAVTLRPGETSTVTLRLHNYDLAPERLALSVAGVPTGWTATLMGGGQPVAAAMPATNASVSLELRLDVPKNAAVGTQTLTVTATGGTTKAAAADRGHAGQGSAGQADGDAAASRTARHLEVELRVSAQHQERQRQEADRQPVRASAAEFRRLLHRAVRQPGAQRRADRCRPDQGREAQSARRRTRPRPAPTRSSRGSRPRTPRRRADLALDITGQPKLDISGREGLVSTRASAGKETTVPVVITNTGTAPADDVELCGSAPSGWKVTFDPKTRRPHRAERQQGSAGADHADREGDRRRLCDDDPRLGARRVGVHHLPRHGDDLDDVGHRRRRHHRRRAAGHGRRGGEVRPAMSEDTVIEASGLTKNYGAAVAVDHISFTRRARARFSDCSGRTAPARRRPS